MSWGFTVSRKDRREMERANAKLPVALQEVPRYEWPLAQRLHPRPPQQVWRSRDFLVQVFHEDEPDVARLSINRTRVNASGDRWDENISWDELQRLKRECGFGKAWAVEIFPADDEVVNVANMRHLFVLAEAPGYAWQRSRP